MSIQRVTPVHPFLPLEEVPPGMQRARSPPPSLVSLSASPWLLVPFTPFRICVPQSSTQTLFSFSSAPLSRAEPLYAAASPHPSTLHFPRQSLAGYPPLLYESQCASGERDPTPHPGMVLDWLKLMGWGNPSFPKPSIGTWHLATGSMCSVRQEGFAGQGAS